MRDTFIAELEKLAKNDPTILLVTGDLGFGVFNNFRKKFPDQFINAGIAEQNMMGLATGLAMEGYKVFTYSIANFPSLRCLEQLRNDSAYHEANVTVVSIGGGFSYGSLGMSHHATEDLSIMRALPIDVVVPNDHWEVTKLTRELANKKGTSYLRLDKSNSEIQRANEEIFNYTSVKKIRDGSDFTLISAGGITQECINAASELEKINISVRILAVHSLHTLDFKEIEKAVLETKGLITVEENTVHGGLGSFISENLMERGSFPRSFYRIGMRDGFSKVVGSQTYLRNYYKMDSIAIVKKIKEII